MNNKSHSSEDLYHRYHKARESGNKALMNSYAELLKGRAAIGKSDAKKYFDLISMGKRGSHE